MKDTIELPSESHADGRIADKRAGKVDIEQLLTFIFPRSLQHPLSTGRLYAFGMYGPLDENGNLRAGHCGQRVVSAWEIDAMCLHFEREDILQVADRWCMVLCSWSDSPMKVVKCGLCRLWYQQQLSRGCGGSFSR